MCPKIVSEKEFNNIWFRTGKDPDGNDMSEIILGGVDDSYNKYILNKQKTYQVKFTPLISINTLEPVINSDPLGLNPNQQLQQIEKLYIWRSMDDDKVRSEHADKDDEIFNWNDDDIKPGEDYGCRCYAEFLDENGNPAGEYGRIAWPEKGTESNPKPHYEPTDKNGVPLNEKDWKDLTNKEKELRKQEEIEKFKNSDKLRDNIKKAEEMKDTWPWEKLPWFREQVKAGGPWDYKKDGHPEMEHVGNFNYGATGKAAGFSDAELKIAAGGYQLISGTSDSSFISSYFDDPRDMEQIENGIEWYNNNY